MFKKKSLALLVSLMLILCATVGTTLALLIDKTLSVENIFTPSKVTTEVDEDIETDPDVKQNVRIRNTGDTTAYIRVAVVVNWVNADNKQVYAQAPSFTVTPENTNWVLGVDGYYYYKMPVEAGAVITEELTVALLPESATAPAGHTLQVEVVASAIQATSAAVSQWSGGVAIADTDGANLTVTKKQ